MTDLPEEKTGDTDLDELNPEGVGATTGADNTFEPEEEPEAHVDTES